MKTIANYTVNGVNYRAIFDGALSRPQVEQKLLARRVGRGAIRSITSLDAIPLGAFEPKRGKAWCPQVSWLERSQPREV